MKRRLIAGLLLAFAAPLEAAPEEAGNPVAITRAGDRWTAEFQFDRKSPVWAFMRSNVTRGDKSSWRLKSWKVLTPGVELKRLGAYDALVSRRGPVPKRVRISFEPYADDLLADYDPALVFTDGSVALFTGHWDAFPVASEAEAAALPADLSGVTVDGFASARLALHYVDGRIRHDGRDHRRLELVNPDTYVLFGSAKSVDSRAITTVIDPQLPAWLSSEILAFTPRLLDVYASKLGPRSDAKPMVMVSWAGPTPRVMSLGGSVLPGLVIMRLEGEDLIKSDAAALAYARWFIAHESAHFWLGQVVRYASPRESWITEGGADLLAIRAAEHVDPDYDSQKPLQDRLDECQAMAAKGPIASAFERNEHRVYYACGAMFALAAEATARKSGGDIYTFLRAAIEANRADGILDRADWLAAFGSIGAPTEGGRIIAAMLDSATPDATAKLARLFDLTGVAYRRNAAGKLLLS